MEFSEILNNLIIEHSTTQKELAKSCGLSPQCVSALVTGRNKPTGITLIALSKYFGCSSDYLLGLEDDFGARQEQNTGNVIHAAHSSEESRLLEIYRTLSPDMRATLWSLLDTWNPKISNKNKA